MHHDQVLEELLLIDCGWIPVVGSGCDAYDVKRSAEEGDNTGTLLGMAGFLPIIGDAMKLPDQLKDLERVADAAEAAKRKPEGVGVNPDAPKPLGRGNTGRTEARNLKEQIAMKQAMSDPAGPRARVVPLKKGMTDQRWPGDEGWQKMTQNIDGIEIHYVYNPRTSEVGDYKFK